MNKIVCPRCSSENYTSSPQVKGKCAICGHYFIGDAKADAQRRPWCSYALPEVEKKS